MKEFIFVNIFMHHKNEKYKKMNHDNIVYQTWLSTMIVWKIIFMQYEHERI